MTTIKIIILAVFALSLIIYGFECYRSAKRTAEANRKTELESDQIGKTIYELFPEWENEISEKLDKNAAFINLYLAAQDITKHGVNVRNMAKLTDEVKNCKRLFI